MFSEATMPTEKQIEASRANGAGSKGPLTAQGKLNSSRNSRRHGLLARTVVLEAESTVRFHQLLHRLPRGAPAPHRDSAHAGRNHGGRPLASAPRLGRAEVGPRPRHRPSGRKRRTTRGPCHLLLRRPARCHPPRRPPAALRHRPRPPVRPSPRPAQGSAIQTRARQP